MKPLANWIAFPRKIIIYCLPWLFFNISLAYLVTQPSWQEACVQYSFRRQRPGTRRDCGTRDAGQLSLALHVICSRVYHGLKMMLAKLKPCSYRRKCTVRVLANFHSIFTQVFVKCAAFDAFFCRSARSRGQHSRLISMSRNLIFGKTWHFISSYM